MKTSHRTRQLKQSLITGLIPFAVNGIYTCLRQVFLARTLSSIIAKIVIAYAFFVLSLNQVQAQSESVVKSEYIQVKCIASDIVPARYKRYQVPPWELLKLTDFKRAYWNALQPIKQYKLTPYIKKLDVVWGRSMNRVCMTPNGLAMIYEGEKPHWATDSLRIVYFPDSKIIAIRIKDEFVNYQSGDFGTLNNVTIGILNEEICGKGEE